MGEIASYLIFGVLTTLINFVVYMAADALLHHTVAATIIAWIIAVLFAFVTNKMFVFKSKNLTAKQLFFEVVAFTSVRVFSGFVDLGIMIVGVDIIGLNKMFVKLASNGVITVMNYIASKLFIFKKKI